MTQLLVFILVRNCNDVRIYLLLCSLLFIVSLFNGSVSVFGQDIYRSQAEARAAAADALTRIEENEKCVQRQEERNARNNEENQQAFLELSKLQIEKKKALKEFQAGFFCSKCKRSKSEIERAEKKTFAEHLNNVKGVPVPATSEQIKEKAEEYDQKIKDAEQKRETIKKNHERIVEGAMSCYGQMEVARYNYYVATLWEQRIGALGLPKNLIDLRTPELTPERFGLDGNKINSPCCPLRVYYKKEKGVPQKVETWVSPLNLDWSKIEKIRPHMGIDYSSRYAPGEDPEPMAFKAGFEGVIRVVGGPWNTVDLILPNGNRLQFMHASDILVRNGQRVRPDDYIGYTGDAGPGVRGKIHLHVGARDRFGNQIDPRLALMGLTDWYMVIYRDAERLSLYNQYRIPNLVWYKFQ